MTETALIVAQEITPSVFTVEDELAAILGKIETESMAHVPVLETAAGRKEIASMAYKVARSKTALDKFGKNLVADIKAKAVKIDKSRKHARDFLDDLRDRVRQPLTDWEKAEEARKESERLAEEILNAWDQAIAENDLFDRQREIERKEADLRRQEEARIAAERKVREEQERKERDARIAREAAERVKREAEAEANRLKAEAERAERERIAAIERAKIEKELAIKAAKEQAEREAAEREIARIAKAEAERKERERIAADKEHRKSINNAALACFELHGIDTGIAKTIIGLIANGSIDYITINY